MKEMMMKQDREKSQAPESAKSEATRANPGSPGSKPRFEPPEVITYSGDDILDELGPAHACNPFSGAVVAC
jgi:hypothetical protein